MFYITRVIPVDEEQHMFRDTFLHQSLDKTCF